MRHGAVRGSRGPGAAAQMGRTVIACLHHRGAHSNRHLPPQPLVVPEQTVALMVCSPSGFPRRVATTSVDHASGKVTRAGPFCSICMCVRSRSLPLPRSCRVRETASRCCPALRGRGGFNVHPRAPRECESHDDCSTRTPIQRERSCRRPVSISARAIECACGAVKEENRAGQDFWGEVGRGGTVR